MSSFAYRLCSLLQTAVVTVAVACGLYLSTSQPPSQPPTHDALAEGGQWGNKGGRGFC